MPNRFGNARHLHRLHDIGTLTWQVLRDPLVVFGCDFHPRSESNSVDGPWCGWRRGGRSRKGGGSSSWTRKTWSRGSRSPRAPRGPFFFRPLQFLVFDPLALFTFAGLTTAAILLRRRTDWHRRLHFCAMAILLGPGFGRLLPMPLLAPWAWEATVAASLLFPIVGIVSDSRRSGRVHPAWVWGVAITIGYALATEAITYSPVGHALYQAVTVGSPAAGVSPLDFAPPPGAPISGHAATN